MKVAIPFAAALTLSACTHEPSPLEREAGPGNDEINFTISENPNQREATFTVSVEDGESAIFSCNKGATTKAFNFVKEQIPHTTLDQQNTIKALIEKQVFQSCNTTRFSYESRGDDGTYNKIDFIISKNTDGTVLLNHQNSNSNGIVFDPNNLQEAKALEWLTNEFGYLNDWKIRSLMTALAIKVENLYSADTRPKAEPA